jgi:integrase
MHSQTRPAPARRDTRQWTRVQPVTSGALYRQSGTDRYKSVVYADGRQSSKSFSADSDTQARKLHAKHCVRVDDGLEPVKSKATIADVWADFLKSRDGLLAPRTRTTYQERYRTHIEPTLGAVQVQKFSTTHARSWLGELRRHGVTGWTARGAYTLLNQLVEHALTMELEQGRPLIVDNPLKRLKKIEVPRGQNKSDARTLTDDECRLLVEHALPSTRALIATAVFTGMRQSELLGLMWQDLDTDAKLIYVRHQLGRKPRVRLPLKTQAGRRDVGVWPELIPFLKKHKAEAFARGHARPEDYVFCTENGLPLSQRNTARDFATAGDRAGLNPKKGEEGQAVSLHDLRHTHGSRLIALGFDVVTVQRQLGHASPAITLRLYAHEFEQANGRDTFREKIEGSGLGRVFS